MRSARASLLFVRDVNVVAELCEEFFTHLREGLFIIDKENALSCGEWCVAGGSIDRPFGDLRE